jgi:hypothetical protein
MKNNKKVNYILVAALAITQTVATAADFSASLLNPLYYNDGNTQVQTGVVSFGFFNNQSVVNVVTGANAATDLMSYYELNFSELYRGNIVGGILDINSLGGDAPTLLSQANGQAMFARISAPSTGSDYVNGLFYLADPLASDAPWNWTYADFTEGVVNAFHFATEATGLQTPEDYGVYSKAVLGGSDSKLTLSAVTTSAAVPEPSSFSLMLLGGTALVALRRLRKNV